MRKRFLFLCIYAANASYLLSSNSFSKLQIVDIQFYYTAYTSLKERCTDFGIAKRFVAFYSLPVNWGAKQYGVGKTICEAGIGRLGLIK